MPGLTTRENFTGPWKKNLFRLRTYTTHVINMALDFTYVIFSKWPAIKKLLKCV